MDLVYALADQVSVRIDDYHLNIGDQAYFEGHCYMKSIGPSLTGLPVYVVFTGLVRLPPLASMSQGKQGARGIADARAGVRGVPPARAGRTRRWTSAPVSRHGVEVRHILTVTVVSATFGGVVYLCASRFPQIAATTWPLLSC
jgi:hypothetical protein